MLNYLPFILQENESPIADISWSPNSAKLAVATSDRLIMLFDREGVRRDKFNTKPADPAAGKKSYVITSLSFSENSELLGVAQSDHMVFVYRVGADWSGKKVICNKFPLSGAPTQLLPAELGFYAGTTDGKVRILDCKTNKSTSLWTSGSCCVALARGGGRDGSAPLASGHVDGTIYLNGRLLLRYALPPTALALTPPYLIVGSCDGRVSVYEAQRGALLRSLEPPLPADCRDLITAVPSPSGQIIAFGIFDGCLLGEVKDSGVLELTMLKIDKLRAARALAWSGDGTRLALAAQSGALLQLEAVLRRWVWRDTVEVQHLSPRQLVLTRCAHDAPPLTVTTTLAQDIHNVKFIGEPCYCIDRLLSMVRHWLCYLSPRRLVLTRCAHDAPPLTVTTTLAQDIHNVKFIGEPCYCIDRLLSMVRHWLCYLSPRRLVLTRCAHDAPPLTVTTTLAQDIHNVKFIGEPCYCIDRLLSMVRHWLCYLSPRRLVLTRCAHDAPPLTVTTTLAQDIHNVKFIGEPCYCIDRLLSMVRHWLCYLSPRRLVLTRCAHDAPPLTVTTTLAQDIHNVKFIGEPCYCIDRLLSMVRHWLCYLSPRRLVLTRCAHDAPPLTVTTTLAQDIHNVKFIVYPLTRCAHDAPPHTVTTTLAQDIHNVKFIGNDWYAVCRTSSSLILCDIARGLTSEIPWSGTGQRIYAAVGGACLLHRAGELSVVEYGLDRVLHTVRTERVNPHVLSVRINEARAHDDVTERKHLAYLLDRQTVAVLDLVTGIQVGQWWHEARVDWLELNESGQLLLMRDTRRRLALLNLRTGDKEIIASAVGFVQWIEQSDAVVAQTPTHLLIWYSAWDPGSVEMAESGGGTAVEVVARRVVLEGGPVPYLQLDDHRLEFNNALASGDLAGCARYLDGVGNNADIAPLWRQLAERAFANEDVQLAAKCYREVGDDARTFYLDKTVELASTEGHGDVSEGLHSPLVQARLAIFTGDLASAEECYTKKAGQPELAIQMYKQFNRWTEAIAVAEKTDRSVVAELKQQHMDYLISTGKLYFRHFRIFCIGIRCMVHKIAATYRCYDICSNCYIIRSTCYDIRSKRYDICSKRYDIRSKRYDIRSNLSLHYNNVA
ncbi:hypothetical protein JYU34_021282 [Plutella xylostella]|uniref:Uncharacterized protein n=1 Tax=Plutella xylostella TaxID=51655 RepID=A0ABQ7PT83_PLUXY|nr:hypothetical protein JYU34_021282 [Plutella xylostella]